MAKHAEKKAMENAVFWTGILRPFLVILNVCYIWAILYTIRTYERWTYSDIIWPVLYMWIGYKVYHMIKSELE